MKTLLLDQSAWDLVLDSAGNIALASEPYALAQDVASAVRLFQGELYYDTTKGVPYFEQVLGEMPPASVFTQLMVRAANAVPGVLSAQCVLSKLSNRTVTGQITFTDDTGSTQSVNI